MNIPKSHPRYLSLSNQEILISGIKKGITSLQGLMAHGRGEAFDYLIGEKTQPFARSAISAAAALLALANHPVLSLNGNVCALAPKEMHALSNAASAPIEINIFHTSKKRELAMKKELSKVGVKEVLMPSKKYTIPYIESNRRFVNKDGIYRSDVIFVPLEDGDRCQALVKDKRKVITIDLNPLSRTAQTSTITIVDHLNRCLPLITKQVLAYKKKSPAQLKKIVASYNNKKSLSAAMAQMKKTLSQKR